MTPLQALIDARALLADPEHWTQGAFARDADGKPLSSTSAPEACKWCPVGAISRCSPEWDIGYRAFIELKQDTWVDVGDWNDAPERTHAEVLAAFDAAIARLEAQQ